MLSVIQSSFSQTAQRHELWKLQECILGVRHSERTDVLGDLLTNRDRGTMTCFPTSPAPPKMPLGVRLHILPGPPLARPPWEGQLPAWPRAHPAIPGSPPSPPRPSVT